MRTTTLTAAAVLMLAGLSGLLAPEIAASPAQAAVSSHRPVILRSKAVPPTPAVRPATHKPSPKVKTTGTTPDPLGSPATAKPTGPQPRIPAKARAESVPAGDSVVSDAHASAAPVRYCPNNDYYAQWDPGCDEVESFGEPTAVPNGHFVIMRCWIGNGGDFPQYGWTSQKWFYITVATGNPETEVSGFMYSMVVADQVSTPECGSSQFDDYPNDPHGASITIANRPSAGQITINPNDIAFGPATLYCHVGSASGYPTGGTVADLGTFDIDSDNYWAGLVISACGSGNQWIGIITSDGIIRYSNEISIGSSAPPPTPGYLGGIGGQPLTFTTTNGYVVDSSITVTGYPAENFGQTNVTVRYLALAVTSPTEGTYELICASNLTVAPGQIVYCPGTFTPGEAGTWQLNVAWQGSDGNWHDLYEPLDVQIAPAPPRPGNDDFANATDVTGTTAFFSGTNYGATAQPGEPDHLAGYSAANSVWYKFTAPKTGRAWVTMDDTDHSPVAVAAYTGGDVANLSRLAEWDGDGNDAIAFMVTEGDVYYFAIDDYGYGAGGQFSGTMSIDSLDPPSNDTFASAQPIAPGDNYDVDFDDAVVEPNEPVIYPDEPDLGVVWYSFTTSPVQDMTLSLDTNSGTGGVVLGLFTGSSLSNLSEIDYSYLGQDLGAGWSADLPAGQTYYIALDDFIGPDQTSGIPDGLQYSFSASATPVNDDFLNATDITTTGQIAGDNTYATAEPSEPGHDPDGYPASNSVWFQFTAKTSGRAWVKMDAADYGPTDVAAYMGGLVDNLTQLATWDAENDEDIAFLVTKGYTYDIAVDSFEGDGGTGTFAGTLQVIPVHPPANGDFADAQPLTSGADNHVNFTDATAQAGDPVIYPGDADSEVVWYSYTPAENTPITFTSPDTGNGFADIGIFTGSTLASLRRVAYSFLTQNPDDSVTENLKAGQTYYIAFDDPEGDPISGVPDPLQFDFVATVPTPPLTITTVLPTLYWNAHYSIQLQAADGTAPYTWRLKQRSSATGVGNFTLSPTGVLSGSSTGDWGEGWLDIEITDSSNPPVTTEVWLAETVRRDTTPPTGHITKITTATGSATVHWTASDSQSGYDHAQIRTQRIAAHGPQPGWVMTKALGGTSATVRVSTTARYRIEIRFADKSGNLSGWTQAKVVAIQA